MAVSQKYPFAMVGDSGGQLEDWRLDGYGDQNTDRGVVYVKIETSGTAVTVRLYSDEDRTNEVANGSGTAGNRVTLNAVGASGLSGSVVVNKAGSTSSIDLIVTLVTLNDLEEAVDRVQELQLETYTENNFLSIQRKVMRSFYIKLLKIYPPSPNLGDPLRFYRTRRPGPGKKGELEVYAEFLWRRNGRSRFEMVGLQNVTDYKDWAITEATWRIWDRRVEGGELDEKFQRVLQLKQQAKHEFSEVDPWIDVDRNRSADRIAKTSSIRFERG